MAPHSIGRLLRPYLQHFIFFGPYEWAKMLQQYIAQGSRLKRLACNKQSSLLGPFVSYE
jgi:hypothetical protein